MKWGAFGLGLSGAVFLLAANTSAFAAPSGYDRAPQESSNSHRSAMDEQSMDGQRADNAPEQKSVPAHRHHSKQGASTEPRANWAGDSAPDPDNDDPNPVYPI